MTLEVKTDHFLINHNEDFQLTLNPGFPFVQAISSQAVSPLGCAQPAACRMLSTGAEELLAIRAP